MSSTSHEFISQEGIDATPSGNNPDVRFLESAATFDDADARRCALQLALGTDATIVIYRSSFDPAAPPGGTAQAPQFYLSRQLDLAKRGEELNAGEANKYVEKVGFDLFRVSANLLATPGDLKNAVLGIVNGLSQQPPSNGGPP